jgi:hypothetical protein
MRKRFKALAVAAVAAGSIVLGTAPAFADTYTNVVNDRYDTSSVWYPDLGTCYGQLDTAWDSTQGYWVTRGEFYSSSSTCRGWLERSTDGGSTYHIVSSGYKYGPSTGSNSAKTGWHWDGSTGSNVLSRVHIEHDALMADQVTTAW